MFTRQFLFSLKICYNNDDKGGQMEISAALARFLGLFFIVVGLSFIKNGARFTSIVDEILSNKGLQLVAGLLPTLVGSLIIGLNSIGPNSWFIVTLVGYLMLFGGAFRLMFTEQWLELVKKCHEKVSPLYIGGIVAAIGGFFLLISCF